MPLLSTTFLQIFLPTYFLVYFGIAFVLKTVIVARRIKKNPIVFPKDDSAFTLVGNYFKVTLFGLFVFTVIYGIHPVQTEAFLPFPFQLPGYFRYLGVALMTVALFWTVVAQHDMKDSWRIGIDTEKKTELVKTGLFKYSRNPVFVGMIASLFGVFLAVPTGLTVLFLLFGYVLIQIQVRLEEDFLRNEFGEEYVAYAEKVRRYL